MYKFFQNHCAKETTPHLRGPGTRRAAWQYLASFLGVVLVTLGCTQLLSTLHQSSILLIYLLLVLVTATLAGLGPAISTAVLSFVCFTFFFAPPIYALTIDAPQDGLALLVFMIVAVTASSLTGQVRKQATTAQQQAAVLTTLYQLSQAVSAEVDLERMLPRIAKATMQLTGGQGCQILLYDADGQLREHTRVGTLAAARPALDTLIQTQRQPPLGVLRVVQSEAHSAVVPAPDLLLALASQLALVLERTRLFEEASHMHALAESNQLKSALLLSVSHDLRTPLALIKGTVTNLLDDSLTWDRHTQHTFFCSIDAATNRLNRFVDNLLDMARIEAGKLHAARSWQDIHDLVSAALEHSQPLLAAHPVTLTMAADLPLLHVDCAQIEQVLVNLLDNAIKYTPPGTPIFIGAWVNNDTMALEVRDAGPGLSPQLLPHLFERFVRAVDPEQSAEGTGLGLAICKGLIEAHNGRIWAENMPTGGARFVLLLPLPTEQAQPYREIVDA